MDDAYLNITGVKAFLAIAATRSISKAAEMLFSTQSTVSVQLKNLETELGIRLVERRKGYRTVELTQKGKDFISIAERFVQLGKEAKALRYEKEMSLTVSGVDSLNIYAFAPFFHQIAEENDTPINLRIFTHQTAEIYEQIENRAADVGFVLYQRRYQNVFTKTLFREKMLLVKFGAKKSGQRKRLCVHPRDLDFGNEIFFNWGTEFSLWHELWRSPNTNPHIQVDTVTMIMKFLRGEYWSVLPESIINSLRAQYSLQVFSLREAPPDRVCYELTHRFPNPANLPAMHIFEEKLQRYLRSRR
jgi:DNA-binding transcriptional LysR family regulator